MCGRLAVVELMECRVAIIVPVWNGAAHVRDALAGIAAQTFHDWQALLVDDGSTDGSADILGRWARDRGARAHVLRSVDGRNHGVASARNAGLDAAHAPLVAFLDQDDVWAPDKLASQIAWLDTHPDVPAVSCIPEIEWRSGKPEPVLSAWYNTLKAIARRKPPRVQPADFLTGCPFPMSGVMVRRSTLETVGRFDATFSRTSDWLLWACLAHGTGSELGLIDEPLFRYRLHGANDIHRVTNDPARMLCEAIDIADALARWLSPRRGLPVDELRTRLARQTDWGQAARDAGVRAADWRNLLLEAMP